MPCLLQSSQGEKKCICVIAIKFNKRTSQNIGKKTDKEYLNKIHILKSAQLDGIHPS